MGPRGNRRLVLVAAFGVLIGAVAVAGYWRWAPWKARPVAVQTDAPVAAAAPAPERSIAVLPFTNLSTEKENAFFTDGVHDEILTDLAKVADLKVISRTSVMSYREAGEQRNLPEIARALGVANVLEGSVQRVAGRVRVTAQLIDARTDTHLWADKYDRDLTDVFAIQSEIANAIVTQLRAKLSPREQAAMHERSTSDMEAYDLYLRAKELRERSYSNLGNRGAANLEAVSLLEQATRRDPAFVRAWCLLARVHDTLYSMRNDPTSERRAMAEQAIESAARLQPNSAEVHLARAWHAYNAARDFETARKELALVIRDMPKPGRSLRTDRLH
jgi:TolB-like protein